MDNNNEDPKPRPNLSYQQPREKFRQGEEISKPKLTRVEILKTIAFKNVMERRQNNKKLNHSEEINDMKKHISASVSDQSKTKMEWTDYKKLTPNQKAALKAHKAVTERKNKK